MSPFLKIVIGIVLGIVIGSAVNMGLIILGPSLIPPPEGVDPMDAESIAANIGLFKPKHFLFPFLAHALGTLAGSFTAAKIVPTQKKAFALVIGAFFFTGGLWSIMSIPAPAWFNALDLIVAYIPMALLGHRLAVR